MLRTIFQIPLEVGGWPVFGFGLLFWAWLAFSAVLMVWLVRRQGWTADTQSYLPILTIVAVAIAFVFPRIAEADGLAIRGYGTMLVLATFAACGLAAYRARQIGLDPEVIYSLAFWLFLAGIGGARLRKRSRSRGQTTSLSASSSPVLTRAPLVSLPVDRALAAAALIAATGCAERLAFEIGRPPSTSNIRAADYVGPEACGECHADKFQQWSGNLHRSMNRRASDPGVIAGDFSGVELTYGGKVARFERDGENRPRMVLDGLAYPITRTIGSRYIQEYVGVDPEGTEVRLPFGYWITRRQWFHNQYYDSWYGPEYAESGELAIDAFKPEPWASRCAWCHNTYPFELRIARADQASIAAFGPEAHVTAPTKPRPAIAATNELPTRELVTVGISCESCHFGGRDHAVNGAAIRFAPVAPDLERRPGGADLSGGRTSATAVNAICAQCHSAPSPKWPSGAAMRNSREAARSGRLRLSRRAAPTATTRTSPARAATRRFNRLRSPPARAATPIRWGRSTAITSSAMRLAWTATCRGSSRGSATWSAATRSAPSPRPS